MLARLGGPILEPFSLKTDPADPQRFHVAFGQVSGSFRFKPGHLSHLLAAERPIQPRLQARIIARFRKFHALPESFKAGIALAAKDERSGRKIGKQTEFMPLGKDDFAGPGFLRQNLPGRGAFLGHGRPPMSRVSGRGLGLGGVTAAELRQEQQNGATCSLEQPASEASSAVPFCSGPRRDAAITRSRGRLRYAEIGFELWRAHTSLVATCFVRVLIYTKAKSNR